MNRGPAAAAAAACCSSSAVYIRLRCGTSRSQECVRVCVRVRVCLRVSSACRDSFPTSPKATFFFNTTRITVKSRITEGMVLQGNVHVDFEGCGVYLGIFKVKSCARIVFGPFSPRLKGKDLNQLKMNVKFVILFIFKCITVEMGYMIALQSGHSINIRM